jgi:citrate lyase synthetase
MEAFQWYNDDMQKWLKQAAAKKIHVDKVTEKILKKYNRPFTVQTIRRHIAETKNLNLNNLMI